MERRIRSLNRAADLFAGVLTRRLVRWARLPSSVCTKWQCWQRSAQEPANTVLSPAVVAGWQPWLAVRVAHPIVERRSTADGDVGRYILAGESPVGNRCHKDHRMESGATEHPVPQTDGTALSLCLRGSMAPADGQPLITPSGRSRATFLLMPALCRTSTTWVTSL